MTETAPTAVQVGDLHVEVRGDGPPVLLIHGNSGDLHYFDHNVPALERHFRVAAMDCRGQGRSARGDGPLTIRRMADDAADVIRTLQIDDEPFDVVGFSDGANVAMTLAVHHPELVRRLVLNSGNITRQGMHMSLRVQLRFADELLQRKRQHGVLPVVRHEHELMRLMLDQPGITTEQLAGITAPTLVMAGSKDLIRREHTRLIAKLIPGAQLRIIVDGTHFVMRDMPGVANAVVDDFLRAGAAPVDGVRILDR
ncbi:alpha/beta fold hydrolase [Microbacterium sp. ASV49]|uniref:Alpha/beta hydrolase n=1 Tax=Microbacterium candidum TaxID=3041922 RepID=A0ABT7MUK9_9MICO|nr:alpha/beta hydrolase [Microbacterium sp. ASV49]MDL9978146.1 alpha/beta hydrolase [Microbacterium sp. ASV49]